MFLIVLPLLRPNVYKHRRGRVARGRRRSHGPYPYPPSVRSIGSSLSPTLESVVCGASAPCARVEFLISRLASPGSPMRTARHANKRGRSRRTREWVPRANSNPRAIGVCLARFVVARMRTYKSDDQQAKSEFRPLQHDRTRSACDVTK